MVTFLNRINWTNNVRPVELLDVLREIKTGNMILNSFDGHIHTLAETIWRLRNECPEQEQQEFKEQNLPAVAYNGVFGKDMVLEHYNQITAIDIDHIGGRDKLEDMRIKLQADPHSIALFETPRGDGLKVIVSHENIDPQKHTEMYKQIMVYYDNHDIRCTDIKRRHYLSYDPFLWINPKEATPFHYVESHTVAPVKSSKPKEKKNGRRKSDKSIIAILNSYWKRNNPEYWEEGNRACGIFNCSCLLCKYGIDEELALDYCIDSWDCTGLDMKEIEHNCRGGYSHVRRNNEEDSLEWV